MDAPLRLRGRFTWLWLAVLALQAAALTAFAATVCAKTSAAAIKSVGTKFMLSPVPGNQGYRVAGVRWDPVMRQSWASIASCAHPEWPEFSLRMDEVKEALHESVSPVPLEPAVAVPIVHAGDVVQLWWQESLLRVEVAGIAEESGGLGETIRVRLLRRSTEGQFHEEELTGVVRGRADVEMQP